MSTNVYRHPVCASRLICRLGSEIGRKNAEISQRLAERVGFEPTVRLPVQRFSRPHSGRSCKLNLVAAARSRRMPSLKNRMIEVQITLVASPRNHLYERAIISSKLACFSLFPMPSWTIFAISPTISISSPFSAGPIATCSINPRGTVTLIGNCRPNDHGRNGSCCDCRLAPCQHSLMAKHA
jgi:hypothetical protein